MTWERFFSVRFQCKQNERITSRTTIRFLHKQYALLTVEYVTWIIASFEEIQLFFVENKFKLWNKSVLRFNFGWNFQIKYDKKTDDNVQT